MTDNELKAKVRDSLNNYLTNIGFPDKVSVSQVLTNEHLLGMWKKLDKEGLVEPLKIRGYTYQRFVNTAVQKAQEAEILAQMFGAFGNPFRR